ncbi:MAG: acetyl-CoA C-acyltransferase [Gammaproteobacteria bacterium]|jgi:acetyl-CoA C-acetyltransferase|nr:acetyl-CoA C-acyltransferase [Gammaproteobacteria bacterium]|tara:strand:+ start:264 stop:1457 length:1194 start_codon:yes stop_codon:yes gene_type:complete
MKIEDPIVITGIARTPIGGFLGELSPVKATELGSIAISAALNRSGVSSTDVDEVIMGCVLPAGLGQAPARQASIAAGIKKSAGCTTINKVCGSGMKAVMLAHDVLVANSAKIVIAGGMESMSNAPHLLPASRKGYRFGHNKIIDHMAFDGLEDAYEGEPMGVYAELCADTYKFDRESQDNFAVESLRRAQSAIESGAFDDEIVPVEVSHRGKLKTVRSDEQPLKAQFDKIPLLKPAFKKSGTVTAANASSISDGAAAIVLMRNSEALARGIKPVAKIVSHVSHSQEPSEFTTAPIGAIEKLMDQVNWKISEVDLFEINEAFAVVPMASIQTLGLDHSIVNVNGGACALGHPIGCSGARIIVTLLSALQNNNRNKGVASLCIGGGEATALAVELLGLT